MLEHVESDCLVLHLRVTNLRVEGKGRKREGREGKKGKVMGGKEEKVERVREGTERGG